VRWGERYRRTTPARRAACFLVAAVLLASAAPARAQDAPRSTTAAVAITYLVQQEITGQVIGPAIVVPSQARDFRLESAGTAVNGPASVSVVLQFSYDAGLTWQHVVGASGGELAPTFTGHGLTGRVEGAPALARIVVNVSGIARLAVRGDFLVPAVVARAAFAA
jgi:hypothetical protein